MNSATICSIFGVRFDNWRRLSRTKTKIMFFNYNEGKQKQKFSGVVSMIFEIVMNSQHNRLNLNLASHEEKSILFTSSAFSMNVRFSQSNRFLIIHKPSLLRRVITRSSEWQICQRSNHQEQCKYSRLIASLSVFKRRCQKSENRYARLKLYKAQEPSSINSRRRMVQESFSLTDIVARLRSDLSLSSPMLFDIDCLSLVWETEIVAATF